jgi:putative FmdB family regulatory protein
MPTYQYACTDASCANRFELVQSFTDPAASECPVCGGPVRKVYGSVGVVFKGSGFYRTDSRESASNGVKAKSETGKSDSPSEGSSGSKAEGSKSEKPKSETSSSKSDSSSASASSSSSSSPAAAAS